MERSKRIENEARVGRTTRAEASAARARVVVLLNNLITERCAGILAAYPEIRSCA